MREDDWIASQVENTCRKLKTSKALAKQCRNYYVGVLLKHSCVTKNVSLYQMRTKSTQLKVNKAR